MKDFRDLLVWQKSHHFTLEVYKTTASFPADERFGLVSQLRRSAASAPANIAEGCGRGATWSFIVSCKWLWDQPARPSIICCSRTICSYFNAERYETLNGQVTEVKRMLAALLQRVNGDRQRVKAAGA